MRRIPLGALVVLLVAVPSAEAVRYRHGLNFGRARTAIAEDASHVDGPSDDGLDTTTSIVGHCWRRSKVRIRCWVYYAHPASTLAYEGGKGDCSSVCFFFCRSTTAAVLRHKRVSFRYQQTSECGVGLDGLRHSYY